jgi:hypothetical protein
MKKPIHYFFGFIFLITIIYLIVSFIALSFDPTEWNIWLRIISIIFSIYVGFKALFLYDKNQSKQF